MLNRSRLSVTVLGATLIAAVWSCTAAPPSQQTGGPDRDLPARITIGYPKGPWWRGDLNSTLLGVSHILVSHRDAKLTEAMMFVPGPVANRSRAEAMQLAVALAARLHDQPQQFSQLARESSEDARTAPWGGAIGVVYTAYLPSEIVDAVGNLKPGQVSRVVETELGFHVVRRDAVPPPQKISASEIVLGYQGAQPNPRPDRAVVARSRSEALALAAELAVKAKADPSRFGALVSRYSDARTAIREGDIGEVSNYDRFAEPLSTFTIAGLKLGEVSNPVDSPEGVRVFLRTAPARREFAMRIFIIGYRVEDSGMSLSTRTRDEAAVLAKQAETTLGRDPASFERLQTEYCAAGVCNRNMFRVQDGEGVLGEFTEGLAKAAVGGIVPEPLVTGRGFVFARREDLTKAEPRAEPSVKLELEQPPPVGLESATAEQLGWYMAALKKNAVEKLELSGELKGNFEQAIDDITRAYQSVEGPARAPVSASADAKLVSVLGAERAQQLALLNRQMLEDLMGRLDGPTHVR